MSREAGSHEQGALRGARRSRRERGSSSWGSGPRKTLLSLGTDELPPAAINGASGKFASYYLGRHHRLIHRHTESMTINPDQTARWTLKIDFELPCPDDAHCGEHNGEVVFLFPLLFLRKSQGRTGFEARDEKGAIVPLLNREPSDEISADAAAKAAVRLLKEAEAGKQNLPEDSLRFVFERICKWRPYLASVILNKLKRELEELDNGILELWEEAGLVEDLELLVDHSLVWVPLRGLPGERRVIEVGHDTELLRRPLLRWHFGELKEPESRWRWWRRWRRRKLAEDPQRVLDTGDGTKYGRTATRLSLSVLGERLAQPLGWMPIEFDFPTIYSRRCDSYHFEMVCPGGLKPRGVRVALDQEGSQPEQGEEAEAEKPEEKRKRLEGSARKTIGSRAAHVYLREGRDVGDIVLRATVGVSSDAFPILWVLMGAITAVMLWSLVAINPTWLVNGEPESRNEIAAGVLLIVPALLGALIVGSDEKAESKLLSGARMLILITGLCCAAAAAVFTGIKPLSSKPQATWAVCASIATAVLIPLVTSWLLSIDAVWRARQLFSTVRRQWLALLVLGGLAIGLFFLLRYVDGDTLVRACMASGLLLLAVLLSLLASNRLPVALEDNRKFLSVGAMLAAAACLVVGCVELQRICAPDAAWQKEAEEAGLRILPFALGSGFALWLVTRLFGPGREELSISPAVGKALIREERIRELRRLREIHARPDQGWSRIVDNVKNLRATKQLRQSSEEDDEGEDRPRGEVTVEPAGRTEGDWWAGEISSTELPEYRSGEFSNLLRPDSGAEGSPDIDAEPEEVEELGIEAIAKREGVPPVDVERALLKEHLDALLDAVSRIGDGGGGRWARLRARVSGS